MLADKPFNPIAAEARHRVNGTLEREGSRCEIGLERFSHAQLWAVR